MKTITRSGIYIPMAAMILTAALAIPASAQQQVPFKGTVQGNDTVTASTITTSGTGIGTLVGAFSLTEETSLAAFTGPAHWVAANGDTIESTFVSSPDFSTGSLGYIMVTEIHTITGGTGRFAGAHGNFVFDRTHIVVPSANGTHITFGSFHGAITPPGSAR